MKTNTAHEHWDEQWTTAQGRADWITPELFVTNAVDLMKKYQLKSVLDLGCGPGRHAIFLAEQGFTVQAMDASPTAVRLLNEVSSSQNLGISTTVGEMTAIDLPTASLDMVVAWNVIYHGDISIVQRSLSEISRILRRGGLFLGTMLSLRNIEVITGSEIACGTYINKEKSDKDHPHYYCSGSELLGLFTGFEPLILQDMEHKESGSGSFHWQFVMEKK